MQIDLAPNSSREGGKIQSLSPKRREVKIVPHACREPLYTHLILIHKMKPCKPKLHRHFP